MIQVFVSRPTAVEKAEEAAYAAFELNIAREGLRARRLGQTDYSLKAPLHAVMDIMDQCSGAIILGYPQVIVRNEVRRGTSIQAHGILFPTPWNQIEGALAMRAKIPVLVVASEGSLGGKGAEQASSRQRGQAARKALAMLPQDYQFQGPTAKRAIREAERRGLLQGEVNALLTVLEARGLSPTEAQAARIRECSDGEVIKDWVRRAVSITFVDALFGNAGR